MKFLSVVVGVMFASACSGDSSDTDEVVGVDSATSSLETLRNHGGYGGHDGIKLGSHAARLAITRGASRLASLQADTIGDNARNGLDDPDPDDGGWDFLLPSSATSHSAATSPPNIFGETGLGVWAAVDSRLAGTRALVAALDAGTGMQRNPDIDSAPDIVFGVLLAELADNPGFAGLARARYDAKRAANGGRLAMPVLFLHGAYDYTCETMKSRLAEPMRADCSDLTEVVVKSGHWMAQERPVEVNAALAKWLAAKLPQYWRT